MYSISPNRPRSTASDDRQECLPHQTLPVPGIEQEKSIPRLWKHAHRATGRIQELGYMATYKYIMSGCQPARGVLHRLKVCVTGNRPAPGINLNRMRRRFYFL